MNHTRYKLAIFDLDGTLIDSSYGIFDTIYDTIQHFSLPDLTSEQLRTFIGPPIERSFQHYYPQLSSQQQKELCCFFRDQYKKEHLLHAALYDGISELLKKLQSCQISTAVATYKRQCFADAILTHLQLSPHLNVICGSDMEGKLTKTDIIQQTISLAGIQDITQVVMIGDSDNDAIGAQQIGLDFIGVTYGFGFQSEQDVRKFPCVAIAHTPDQLANWII